MSVLHRSILALGLLVVALTTGCTATPTSPPTPSASAEPADIASLDAIAIDSESDPDWITATDQGVWVANVNAGLVRYDNSGDITASVATGVIEQAMETGFGSLWLGSHAGTYSVVRVDLADPTRVVSIPLGDARIPPESSFAVTDSRVWFLLGGGPGGNRLASIDPATNTLAESYPAPTGASAVRGGFGSLWVTSNSLDVVNRIDPATGEVQATIDVGNGPQFLAVGADAVWVMDQAVGAVSRIDPETNTAGDPIVVSSRGIDGGDIVAGIDAVWVRTSAELAVQVDPATSKVVRSIGPASGSGSIAISGTAVWISAHDIRTVWRLQP